MFGRGNFKQGRIMCFYPPKNIFVKLLKLHTSQKISSSNNTVQGDFTRPKQQHCVPKWSSSPLHVCSQSETSRSPAELFGSWLLQREGGVQQQSVQSICKLYYFDETAEKDWKPCSTHASPSVALCVNSLRVEKKHAHNFARRIYGSNVAPRRWWKAHVKLIHPRVCWEFSPLLLVTNGANGDPFVPQCSSAVCNLFHF